MNGVFPVYNIDFKIDTTSRSNSPSFAAIKEMETFSIAIDGNVEEWTPMETEGWMRRLMTGKSFTITLNGKRHNGDPGNDYAANLAWKSGLDCSTSMQIDFPSGARLEFDCVLNVTEAEGGDSTAVAALSIEVMSDGKPTYTPAPAYIVTYDANGGYGLGPASFTMPENATFTAAAANVFAPPSGDTFDEWNTQADGLGTSYAAGATVTMPGANLTLYAIWTS